MPKNNEVDEKVEDFFERLYGMTFRLFLDPNSEEDEVNTVELRLGATVDNLALFETQDHAVLYSAATVSELRAKADAAERRAGELENPGQQDDYLDALDALWRVQGNDGPIYKMFLAFVNRVIPLTGADPT